MSVFLSQFRMLCLGAAISCLILVIGARAPAAEISASNALSFCSSAHAEIRGTLIRISDLRDKLLRDLVGKPYPAFGGTGTGGAAYILEASDVEDWFEQAFVDLHNLEILLPRLIADLENKNTSADTVAASCLEGLASAFHWRWQSELLATDRRLSALAHEEQGPTESPTEAEEIERFMRHGRRFTEMAEHLIEERHAILQTLKHWRVRAEVLAVADGSRALAEVQSRVRTCQESFAVELPRYRFIPTRRVALPANAFPKFQDPEQPDLFELSAKNCDIDVQTASLELRLVRWPDGARESVEAPLPYGAHFFIEAANVPADYPGESIEAEIRSGDTATVVQLRPTDEVGIWRSEMLYPAWPADGVVKTP